MRRAGHEVVEDGAARGGDGVKDEPKYLLSYGAGVNSTAILALIKLGQLKYPNLRIVFADPGAEKPSTYCYLKKIQKEFNIEVCKSPKGTIIDYCREKKVIPVRTMRWCTGDFKIKPIAKWQAENDWVDAITILGISVDEKKRAKDTESIYPLIDMGMTREDCKRVIKEAGWQVPDKSGCYICPFKRKIDWISMQTNSPDLFQICVELERNAGFTFHDEKTLMRWLGDEKEQSRLMDFEEYQHCLCVVG